MDVGVERQKGIRKVLLSNWFHKERQHTGLGLRRGQQVHLLQLTHGQKLTAPGSFFRDKEIDSSAE